MRAQIIEFIKELNLTGFAFSKDLPYSSSGEDLYIKNVKRIYVGEESTEQVPFISVMSSHNVDSLVTTISVYFTTDAKQTPTNYQSVVTAIRGIKELFIGEYFRRECSVTTELQADLQITQLDFTFTRLV